MFQDRLSAGKKLAEKLIEYKDTNAIVLAIPRGGVPVGKVIAHDLHLPLDIILAKKIGHPLNSEFAIGAVSMDEVYIDDHPDISREYIERKTDELKTQLLARMKKFRMNKPRLDLEGKIIIVVDDGIATGNTLLASIKMLRKKNPAKIIVAVPVAPTRTSAKVREISDQYICLQEVDFFPGVGAFYVDYSEVSDEEVIKILHQPV